MTPPHTSTTTKHAIWSAQAHMPSVLGRQITIERGEGNYVFDTEGNRYFDACAGLWHTQVGHGRKELATAAAEQIEKLETFHLFGRFLNDQAAELSNVVAELVPIENAKIIFNSGGGDADDLACKLARRYWQLQGKRDKKIILSRDFSYHGLHAFGSAIGGLEFNRLGFGGDSLIPETARVSFHDLEAVERPLDLGLKRRIVLDDQHLLGLGCTHLVLIESRAPPGAAPIPGSVSADAPRAASAVASWRERCVSSSGSHIVMTVPRSTSLSTSIRPPSSWMYWKLS